MIRMTIYAGLGPDDEHGPYEPTTVVHLVEERDLSEKLRQLGLEWRTADYFPTRQTVITLDPQPTTGTDIGAHVRIAAEALESTGLL